MNLIDVPPPECAALPVDSIAVSPDARISREVPLNLLIVYENAPAARRALRVVGRIASTTGGNIKYHCTFWRFDLLADSEWQARATSDALQADLTILSGSEAAELPAHITSWLEACRVGRGLQPHAQLTLFGSYDSWSISLRDQKGLRSARQAPCRPHPGKGGDGGSTTEAISPRPREGYHS